MITGKKYKLLKSDTIDFDGSTLYRIQALKDFGVVHSGELGGYIQSEENLSHDSLCWVGNNAKVYQYATVEKNAKVLNNAIVRGTSIISDHAVVLGNALVSGVSSVYNGASVSGDAILSGYIDVFDNSVIKNAKLSGDFYVIGRTKIIHDVSINNKNHFFSINNVGSENGVLTVYRGKDSPQIYVTRGCFSGTLEEFEKAVKKTHRKNKYAKQYEMLIQFSKLKLG